MKHFHTLTANQAFEKLNSSHNGLSQEEAQKRNQLYGLNEFAKQEKVSKFKKFFSHFKDLMIIILLVSAAISLVITLIEGNYSDLVDVVLIVGIVFLNATMSYIQEAKAEASLEKLKNLSQSECFVLRDGEIVKIKTSLLTIGDVILLESGDIVPADALLIEGINLVVEEAALTGESTGVYKEAKAIKEENVALADRKNMLFKGTLISNGRAKALVVKIGNDTEIGKIATLVTTNKKELSHLEKNMEKVGKVITYSVLVVAALTFVLELFLHPEQKLTEKFLIAVALCVAAIPESLPAVITVISNFGVSLLAKNNVIVKKLQAVETLGACEVICSDKTGTITQNKMTVTNLYLNNKIYQTEFVENNKAFESLTKIAMLCNDTKQSGNALIGDSTETALVSFFQEKGFQKHLIEKENMRVAEISFNSNRKLMTTLNVKKDKYTLYSKGAINSVLKICSKILIDNKILPLDDEEKKQIEKANNKFGRDALRVLAFCFKDISKEQTSNTDNWEEDMVFVGLIGMIDPPRKEVAEAIEKCKKAGIRPVMITGDHSVTAFAIAKQTGIVEKESQVLTGVEIDKMNDEEFLEKLKTINVFARVSPENKVRIVQGFKTLGKVTAMTGDGVNDAPSLKQASIGVGMGITGTEITKDVADIVIADDNFATIVIAVEEGRKIFANITKTIRFLFSANLAEIIAIFFANIFFPKLVFLLPIQILFVNLITDTLPSISLSFEPAEKNIMEKQEKPAIFSKINVLTILFSGLSQGILVLGAFFFATKLFPGQNVVASTMAFVCLNMIQLFYIYSAKYNTSFVSNNPFKNKFGNLAFIVGVLLLVAVVATPINQILKFTSLSLYQWAISISFAFLILPISEIIKFVLNKTHNKKQKKLNAKTAENNQM